MKIRIKFRKYGSMKFIGHLDIMRFFQKAIRRSGIDICYTEGFSPHQVMSFAAPLGVGLLSDGEYLDIEVHSSLPSDSAIAALNKQMVPGIEVTEYVRLDDNSKTAMSQVTAADYVLFDPEDILSSLSKKELEIKIQEFFNQEKIETVKKTKKSERILDLKPLLYDFKTAEREDADIGSSIIFLSVSTGSIDNIKPEFVMEQFLAFIGLDTENKRFITKRLETYGQINGVRLPLSQYGEPILT